MRVLRNIALCAILAIPAQAYDWESAPGWGNGNSNAVSVFYPPQSASPRYVEDVGGTNVWTFAKDVWAADIANGLRERGYWATENAYEDLVLLTNGQLRIRWEHQNLHDIKQAAKEIAIYYIDLSNRDTNGLYNEWYSQFDITLFTNRIEWANSITNPPTWTISNLVAYCEIPTNFFDYTPARWLGATDIGFTNSDTAGGGPLPDGRTNDWTTLDYGWGNMLVVLEAMQDLQVSGLAGVVNDVDESEGMIYAEYLGTNDSGYVQYDADRECSALAITNNVFDTYSSGYPNTTFFSSYDADRLGVRLGTNCFPSGDGNYYFHAYQNRFDGLDGYGAVSAGLWAEQIETLKEESLFLLYESTWIESSISRTTNTTYKSYPDRQIQSTNISEGVSGFVLRAEEAASELEPRAFWDGTNSAWRIGPRLRMPSVEEFCPSSAWTAYDELDIPPDIILGWLEENSLNECGDWGGFGTPYFGAGGNFAFAESSGTVYRHPALIWRPQMIYDPGDLY